MSNRWMSEQDLQARLGGCIFWYDGDVYTVTVHNSTKLSLHRPTDGVLLKIIRPDDPLLDVSGIEVGYCNLLTDHGNIVRYAQRSTAKNWKQGISNQNLKYTGINSQTEVAGFINTGLKFGNQHITNIQGFIDSIKGVFPSLPKAMKYLIETKGGAEIAVSQAVAITKSGIGPMMVHIRAQDVGWIAPNDTVVKVPVGSIDWIVERTLRSVGMSVQIEGA